MIDGGKHAASVAAHHPADHRGRPHHLAALSLAVLAGLGLTGGATPLLAQPESARGPFNVSAEFLAGLPDSLLGAKASRFGGSTVTYFPRRLGSGPMVMIGAGPNSRTSTVDMLRTSARTAFHESGLREIMREGTFAAPKWPGALTFFGEYLAGSGLKQVWSADTGSDFIAVTVTYFDRKDSARIETAVAEKIFGGAVVTAAKPAE